MTPNDSIQEIPHLSEQYYKTRKSLVLFSGLLFAYEFIGIEIKSQPLENLAVEIKSPQATPWVLLLLVAYFTLRYIIEWYQSAALRRRMRISRIDFVSTLAITGLALATFSIQRLLDIQVATEIAAEPSLVLAAFSSIAMISPFLYLVMRRPIFHFEHSPPRQVKILLTLFFAMGLFTAALLFYRYGLDTYWPGAVLGIFGMGASVALVFVTKLVRDRLPLGREKGSA